MIPSTSLIITDMIDRHARHSASKPAFIIGDETVTWSEINARINRIANALLDAGLEKGDKVSLLSLNCFDALAVVFGTMRAGGVIVPLSVMLTPDLVVSLLEDSGSTFFFADVRLKGIIEGIASPVTGVNKIGIGFSNKEWQGIESFIENAGDRHPRVAVSETDEANIVYSSGTTGIPKGIIHTHRIRMLFAMSMGLEARINVESRPILATPLFTNATWMLLMPTTLVGGCTILLTGFTPEAFLEAVEKHRGTHSFLVPTQYQRILDNPVFEHHDISSLQLLITGGGVMSLQLKQQVSEKLKQRNCEFMELYGLTEGVGTTLSSTDMERKTASVGTPIIGTEIRIIDEKGQELPSDKTGEIVGNGGGIMKGYHNRPELTQEIIWNDERGRLFIKTGDVGRLDDEGFLRLIDRKKDMIVSGGINVYPSDIEGVLASHPEVKMAAVVGVSDPDWGETPLAVVIPYSVEKTAETDLKAWANERLAKHQRIRHLRFELEDFPRNAIGKILKRDLRQQFEQEVSDA